ncbi:uncharacterized protein LOC112093437 [Morus notabilis]|uniref:uncharacterized protein LOC112093437 n=1 Tax=Morus notabilis TaxID=981085 RepID=UPI000CED30E6|nr:uncharacterized protein LOC112093437 [Morus notabilis]
MNRPRDADLIPLDPEIERTFRARRREQQGLAGIEEMVDGVGGNNQGNQVVVIAEDRDRAIRDYAIPMLDGLHPGIVRPEIQATKFELKPVMFQMLQTVGQFSVMITDDPHMHLRLFIEVCEAFKAPGVTEEALRLKLFPYSLRDRARAWLNSLPPDSVANWNDLAEKFLVKYFPPNKNAKLRNDITSFQQLEGEALCESWERFKELLRKCPYHGLPYWIQMETFYNGLNASTRAMVDASANGALLVKSYNKAYEILERMSNNNYQWPTERVSAGRRVAGIHEVDAVTALTAQVSSLSNILKSLNVAAPANAATPVALTCVYCGAKHSFENCPSNPESVCYVNNFNQNNNPYSNSYNQGWKQHLNFSWSNQEASSMPGPSKPAYPLGFHQHQHQRQPPQEQLNQRQPHQASSTPMEALLKEYMARNDSLIQGQAALLQSQAASLRTLENQVGQLANVLSNRPQGSLLSDTENPRRDGKEQCKEHCKAITLRNGREIEQPTQ